MNQMYSAATVRAGRLGGELRPRVFGMADSLRGPSWFALLLTSGAAELAVDEVAVSGPALIWRPWKRDARATFQAGAEGHYALIGPTALASAVGHMPVSRDLLELSNRSVAAPLDQGSEALQTLSAAFASVHRELVSERATAHAVVDAYLRIILVEVYRAEQAHSATRERASPSHRLFADFGTLVEAHFRERWTVNDYARALGLSRDRLGDICRRVRGFGPKEVVDRRVELEARLQLEGSSNSIQQIAELLGFSSTAQFNRFFSRVVGSPPGAYRKAFLEGAQDGLSARRRSYEWP